MRFSIAVLVAATAAMLLTSGLTVACTLDRPAVPRPVGYTQIGTDTATPAIAVTHR